MLVCLVVVVQIEVTTRVTEHSSERTGDTSLEV
jgi:hypothetical protein